jgi:SAM-dependent methyltransferase
MKTDQYKKNDCRYCHATLEKPFLELGNQPLANSFLKKEESTVVEFECPLSLTFCENCKLVQLTHVVPADMMFSNYLYVTSTTATFRKHFAAYATSLKEKSLKKDNLLAVDIGSNDGLLLSCYMKEGMRAVGVEPAKNLSDEANKNGITTLNKYFGEDAVDLIIKQHGKADIISGNNVFAHIDDSDSVCRNAYNLLNDNGIFVIEFPYLVTMVEELLFDMIYHEHLSYIGLNSLKHLLNKHNMEIFFVDMVASHGGSLRVFIQKKGGKNIVSEIVDQMLKEEVDKGYTNASIYSEFAGKVYKVREDLIAFVNEAKANGKSISGYGAPAKGNTLINFCKFDSSVINFIVDDNPMKQNMLAPGSKIAVVPGTYLNNNPTDYVIIFAWNFAKEIISNMAHLKEKGVKFIIPLPKPVVV